MSTQEAITKLQEHARAHGGLIEQYLEVARTQAEITKDFLAAAVDENTPGTARKSRGRVISIPANKCTPADVLAKLRAAAESGLTIVHVAFDPETLTIHVATQS